MYKGLFWLADGELIAYKIPCNANGWPDNPQLPYNSRKGDSFTHKATWAEAAREQPRAVRSKPWNYFPRGRVEVKASKVTVYHNPALSSPEFERTIREAFMLNDEKLSIRFVPDHSEHYRTKNGI